MKQLDYLPLRGAAARVFSTEQLLCFVLPGTGILPQQRALLPLPLLTELSFLGMAACFLLLLFFVLAHLLGRHRHRPGPVAAVPAAHASPPLTPSARSVLIVQAGTRHVPVSVEDVCCFFREGRHSFLRTFDKRVYLVPHSLSELQQVLDPGQFFRVNRQLIIHYRACRDFRPAPHGKVEIRLHAPLPGAVVVSQLKAPRFRHWMQR